MLHYRKVYSTYDTIQQQTITTENSIQMCRKEFSYLFKKLQVTHQ